MTTEKEKLCRTCKHWNISGLKTDGVGLCEKILENVSQTDYCASCNFFSITTQKSFGCILWEEKENE